MAEEVAAEVAMVGNRSTAEAEEEEGEGGGAAEATIVCPAVLIRPTVREGNTAVVGAGIRITAAHLIARRADRRL